MVYELEVYSERSRPRRIEGSIRINKGVCDAHRNAPGAVEFGPVSGMIEFGLFMPAVVLRTVCIMWIRKSQTGGATAA